MHIGVELIYIFFIRLKKAILYLTSLTFISRHYKKRTNRTRSLQTTAECHRSYAARTHSATRRNRQLYITEPIMAPIRPDTSHEGAEGPFEGPLLDGIPPPLNAFFASFHEGQCLFGCLYVRGVEEDLCYGCMRAQTAEHRAQYTTHVIHYLQIDPAIDLRVDICVRCARCVMHAYAPGDCIVCIGYFCDNREVLLRQGVAEVPPPPQL
ncbi:uncharacterized protein LOC107273999 [Cephus cinctus]|uniref:Uncharacterized protein LOC107273998 n=1 Tax=Cephus cinctus TaxID=211228 RepID=A0AAJ7FTZ5_CEPCN|nr:uncharacterized protein LOC107273998 [Cephus cinctus]XP_015608195.1 uncharacterized protein LOC107273999 [Cephus cinctus]